MLDIACREESPHLSAAASDLIISREAEEDQAVGNLLIIVVLNVPLWVFRAETNFLARAIIQRTEATIWIGFDIYLWNREVGLIW